MSQADLSLSVVVPLFDEAESVAALVDAVRDALAHAPPWELILVDDGSRDATAAIAGAIAARDERVRLLRLARNYGQTHAMQAGFDHARGAVVVTMDGDLQNDARDIPPLVAKLGEGYDLVAGYRMRRRDTLLTRKLPSWVANRIIAWLTGVRIRDNGCSLKAYRRELLDELHLYSDMHRFLPALAAATAGARIAELPVRHHPRRFGTSKYGLSRIAKLLADLLTIKMISSFRERPLEMFGVLAFLAALSSVACGVAFGLSLVHLPRAMPHAGAAYVIPGCALLFATLACYLMMLGLIAEEALQKTREEEQFLGPVLVEERG